MSSSLAVTRPEQAAAIEQVVIAGDLSKLSPEQRIDYYKTVCDSVGLNPLTKPFDYITLNGKLCLYANKNCTEQLRRVYSVGLSIAARELVDDVYVVTARAILPDGRTDESIGAVQVSGLKGEARANAFMKAETKAKRRVTLSVCGLGMLDETEVSTIPGAKYGESNAAARTTEPTKIGRSANKGGGEAAEAVKGTETHVEPKPPETINVDLPVAMKEEDFACITFEQQKQLHIDFREAWRGLKKDAEKKLQEFLKEEGYVGPDGNGTTKTIPAYLFVELRQKALQVANQG